MAVITRKLSELFEEFLRGWQDKSGVYKYRERIAQLAATGDKSVIVDYEDIIQFNTDLGERLLSQPDESLREFKMAAFEVLSTENASYAAQIQKSLTVRIRGITDKISLRKVNTSHLDKMIAISGMVVRSSELRPLLTDAAFVCPNGHVTKVLQEGVVIKRPLKCEDCEEVRSLELDEKQSSFIDSQILRVQELPEELPPGQLPRFFDVDVVGDIVNAARPGDRIVLSGIVRAEPDLTPGQARTRVFRSKIEGNLIEVSGKDPGQVQVTKEDEFLIRSVASGPDAYQRLIRSVAPAILGHDAVKEAILLLLVGGPQTVLPDGTRLRGDINVFVVGDPGVAKSELLKFAAQVAPRGMFASGKGSSAAGLSAAVIREKNTFMLEAGVVVLADQGIACVHPDTRVILDDKLISVRDLEKNTTLETAYSKGEEIAVGRIGGIVDSLNLNNLRMEHQESTILRKKMFQGHLEVLDFKTGNNLKVTPDHLLLDGDTLTWKRAQDFHIGEYVVAPLRLPAPTSDIFVWDILDDDTPVSLAKQERQELKASLLSKFGTLAAAAQALNLPALKEISWKGFALGDLRKITRGLGTEATWRTRPLTYWKTELNVAKITPEMGYLIGFVMGDGHTTVKKDGSLEICVYQSLSHTRYTETFINCWRKTFSSPIILREREIKSVIRGKEVKSTGVYWSLGKRVFKAIRDKAFGSDLRHCLSLPDGVLAGYVAGLVDSDGCITEKTCRKKGKTYRTFEIVFSLTNDPETNRNLALVLRRFGVLAFVRDTKRNVFQVSVTNRRDCERLRSVISVLSVKASKEITGRIENMPGFSERRPKQLVGEIVRKAYAKVPRTLLIKDGVWSTIYNYSHEQIAPRSAQLQKLVARTGNLMPDEAVHDLLSLVDGDYFLDQITSIHEEGYEGPVYDLYVPSYHNYTANGLIVENCIDEFDKMKEDDRGALHEQMEQQSYHPSTEVLLADGRKVRIGEFVDSEICRNDPEVVRGKDCEVVKPDEPVEVYTENLANGEVVRVPVDRVSRHKAPTSFIKITYSNGRSVIVTPEHPIFVYRDEGVATVRAENALVGDYAPAPRRIPNSSVPVRLQEQAAARGAKEVTQPETLTLKLARILGYLITEGNFYAGSSVEVDFTNLDVRLLDEMRTLMRDEFGLDSTPKRSEGRDAGLRFVSKTLHAWLRLNFPEMVDKARSKKAPAKILGASVAHIREFMTTAFLGDGSVEPGATCYRAASRGLAEDYQDLLLKLEIASKIDADRSNGSYKVYIVGDSLERFFSLVVHPLDPRFEKIRRLVERTRRNNSSQDVLPTSVVRLYTHSLHELGLPYDGRFWRNASRGHVITTSVMARGLDLLEQRLNPIRRCLDDETRSLREIRMEAAWSQQKLAGVIGVPRGKIDYAERGGYDETVRRKLTEKVRDAIRAATESESSTIAYLRESMRMRFLRITAFERLENKGDERCDWVYDLTVEPNRNFISAGTVLHNTVTIAKGGIYATLNARTSILAAANPMLGKYDPYKNLTDNVTLPIPLLTRFDLIFVVKDTPTPAQDEKLAVHILDVHRKRGYTEPPPVQFDLLKKYISYAKKISPILTPAAENRLKEFYLQLRKSAAEGQIGATPRTLESLIRLSSAKARLMLRDQVLEEDALTAISLMNRMVEDVLTDTETKTRADFGILMGQPTGERGRLSVSLEIFRAMEGQEKKPVELRLFRDELIKSGRFKNDEEVDKMIQRLIKEGTIWENKPGFYRRLQS